MFSGMNPLNVTTAVYRLETEDQVLLLKGKMAAVPVTQIQ